MFRRFPFWSSRPPPLQRFGAEEALAALERGEYAVAEAKLDEAVARAVAAPERAFLLNKRGVARVKLGRREEARADFESASESGVPYAPALTNIGNLLLEDGRIEAAIAAYRAAIAADPDHAVAYFNLGAAYKRAGRLADAVRALRDAQRIEGRRNHRPRERR